MFNLEQELEYSYRPEAKIEILNKNDETITVNVENYGRIELDRKTGKAIGYEDNNNCEHRLRKRSGQKPKKVFSIITGQREWPKDQWLCLPRDPYDDPGRAAQDAKEHTRCARDTDSPYLFAVRADTITVADNPIEEWIRQRFETGEYQRLPWADEPWSTEQERAGHICQETGVSIAFFEDFGRDRVTTMRPGRYLEKFYSHVLSSTDIQQWSTKVDTECELHFATTPDEIEDVYIHGPNSCMAYDVSDFSSSVHPTRVYGAGDLAIAYLKRRNKIIARALCWPEEKLVNRMYGDEDRLWNRLEALGYTETYRARKNELFLGARLLLIRDYDRIVLPYLDGFNRVSINGDHLVLDLRGELRGVRTDGLAADQYGDVYSGGPDPYCTCDRCDSNIQDEDDVYYVDNQNWCESCYCEHSSACDDCSNIVSDDNLITVFDGEDVIYDVCRSCANAYPLVDGHCVIVQEQAA